MVLKTLSSLFEIAKSKTKSRLAVAAANDNSVLKAVNSAIKKGIIDPVLVGKKAEINKIAGDIGMDLKNIEIIDETVYNIKLFQ